MLKTVAVVLAVGLWSAAMPSCAASGPSRTRTELGAAPLVWHSAISLPFRPVYLTTVSGSGTVFVYLESERDDALTGHGLLVTADGRRASTLVNLVDGFAAPFGEIAATPAGLLVPVVRRQGDETSEWEVWRWLPPEPPERIMACELPSLVFGRIFAEAGDLYVIFEDSTGDLRGFRTTLERADCPSAHDLVTMASGPLPSRYQLDWLDGQIALSGLSGESYSVRIFGPDLQIQRRLRLATGAAPTVADVRLFDTRARGGVAVYTAALDGAHDLYLSSLSELSAGPPAAVRIVASADVERDPRLFEVGDRIVLSWSVRDSNRGQRVEIASPLPERGVALSGGDVIWREPRDEAGLSSSTWTEAGLLRAWTIDEDGAFALVISPVRPAFWPRPSVTGTAREARKARGPEGPI